MASNKKRKENLMPGGVPKYARFYDNGGGVDRWFCRKCLMKRRDGPECPVCGEQMDDDGDKGTVDRYAVSFFGRGIPSMFFRVSEDGVVECGVYIGGGTYDNGYKKIPGIGELIGIGFRRIPFESLSVNCRKAVLDKYKELWRLKD